MRSYCTFEVEKCDGSARTGTLSHNKGSIETPALLLYTKRGSPLYLTPDTVSHLGTEAQNYILDATQFLGNPSPDTLGKAPGKGRGFCGLQDKFLVVSARDVISYNYQRWVLATDRAVKVVGFAGNQDLKPELYQQVSQMFEPDIWIPLSDEVPAEAEELRVKRSVQRTLNWLDAALEVRARSGSSAQAALLAPIQGGNIEKERERSAAEAAKREGVFGFAICGMGTGETADERTTCLSAAISQLPAEKPRLLQAGSTPDEMLEAVSHGVDLFDATYATQVTGSGHALVLEAGSRDTDARCGHDDTKMNLMDTKFKMDTGSLVEGCTCFTCRHHTRAYIHHLLLVHEMTAQILLELHNVHQLMRWMKRVRQAIMDGQFAKFRDAFLDRKQRIAGAAC